MFGRRLTKLVLKWVAALPLLASAESSLQTGASTLAASANVDFRITIPRVLFLQVGSGTAQANNATINLIDFYVAAASVGNGTTVTASAASGDLGNGTVTARVLANNGTVTFASTTAGALSNGAGSTISYDQIGAVAAVNTTGTVLAHPGLVDGSTTTVALAPVGKIVDQDAKWTYTYKNQNMVPPGTYGGANTNNGRVTYTVSTP
jgi:hypothetical protein